MNILGIDPGYERLGVAIIKKESDQESLVYSDCVETDRSLDHYTRLETIGKEIKKVINQFTPSLMAIETLLFNKNHKTALLVAEARGVVLFQAAVSGVEVYELSPLQIKQAMTGYGRGEKKQVKEMVDRLIKPEKKIKHDDEYDAIAAALAAGADSLYLARLKKTL